MIHKLIEVPSEDFVKRYYAFSPDCADIASVIIGDIADLGLKCYIKEKAVNLEECFNSTFIEIPQILRVTFWDSKNKEKVHNLAGYYSQQESTVLISEGSVFNLLGWCLNHTRIIDHQWDERVQGNLLHNKSTMPKDKRVEHCSLCKVLAVDNKNTRWLERLGDINEKGEIIPVEIQDDKPKFFDNRNYIFWKNGPTKEGYVGIWNWSAIPNKTSSDKDYVESHYESAQSPIEIIEISQADSKESLVECLKRGAPSIPACDRFLFAYQSSRDRYVAVLCDQKMLDFGSGTVKLREGITSLNVYSFDMQFVYKAKTQQFYKYVELGDSSGTVLTKSHVDLMKEIILRRASWSAAKQNKMTKNDWRKFKDFIANISNDSMYQEISALCHCGKEEAKRYVDDFVASADREIDAGDIDSSVMLRIVENNELLRGRCESLVEQKWQSANQAKLKAAQDELERVRKEIAEENKQRVLIEQEIEKQRKRLEQLLVDVAHYELMGDAVRAKVHSKIEEAKKDAAEFISQMVMFAPTMGTVTNVSDAQGVKCYCAGETCADGEYTTGEEALDSIIDELGESGVEGRYVTSFAAFLFSAYTNHAHLLLAGSNGDSIANAFSTALFGKYAGVLDCNQKFSRTAVDEMLSSEDQVVMIKNPFQVDWMNPIMDMLSKTDKFYILVNPFAEDLAVEPKSLYNYVLPVFTDAIISDIPRNEFVGKVQSASFEKYESQKSKPLYNEYLKAMNVSALLANRIQHVLTDLHYLDKDADNSVDYMYIFFPFAYVTGRGRLFADKMEHEKTIDGEKKMYMLNYLGENE